MCLLAAHRHAICNHTLIKRTLTCPMAIKHKVRCQPPNGVMRPAIIEEPGLCTDCINGKASEPPPIPSDKEEYLQAFQTTPPAKPEFTNINDYPNQKNEPPSTFQVSEEAWTLIRPGKSNVYAINPREFIYHLRPDLSYKQIIELLGLEGYTTQMLGSKVSARTRWLKIHNTNQAS